MAGCDWCGRENCLLKSYEHLELGEEYNLCKDCLKAAREGTCTNCGEPLYDGDITIGWECGGCRQISAAREEKERSELIDGLGGEDISDLTHSVEFTEEDYERWMTFSQGSFTPETRRRNRKRWLRRKLIKVQGWPEEVYEANIADIEWIVNNYSYKVFSYSTMFIVNDGSERVARQLMGTTIIARRGNILLIDCSTQ